MLHRMWFGIAAMAILAITVILASIVAWWGSDKAWEHMDSFIRVIIPVETLIIGAMSTYYFGEK